MKGGTDKIRLKNKKNQYDYHGNKMKNNKLKKIIFQILLKV